MSHDLMVQTPFNDAELFMNPEPRVACLLLLDTSGSMAGSPIRQLNEGLAAFKSDMLSDSLAAKRAEIGIITFGPVKIEAGFQTVDNLNPPIFDAGGDTPMGQAIETGLRMLDDRKATYRTCLQLGESAQNQPNRAQPNLRFAGSQDAFAILPQHPALIDPRIRALDDPPLLDDDKPFLGRVLRLRRPPLFRGHFFRQFDLQVRGYLRVGVFQLLP